MSSFSLLQRLTRERPKQLSFLLYSSSTRNGSSSLCTSSFLESIRQRNNNDKTSCHHRHYQTSSQMMNINEENGSVNNSSNINTNMIPLKKVLIANRGEIACRIQRTCHKWDIPTVAIYSIADSCRAHHAYMANESYQIGYNGSSVSESYLLQNDIIDIALQSGCDAIHPGYGFLSENSKFSQLCANNNIQFIGPSSSAIYSMGDKAQSKAIMDAAGVPTTPGYYDENATNEQDESLLYEKAIEIGFPLLIKAVAGGGGKGMRIVYHEKDFKDLLSSCQRESLNSFGNSTVILEKYLINPRHIEIQIAADTVGNCIYLYERDCSVQRRYQKVFEEAPAIDLHPILRHNLGNMACIAAKAVKYTNVGTVEFLLDTNDPNKINSSEQSFYFCEMNTRLQVEHPVTEYITGIDIVEWQLRIAAKQTLPILKQEQLSAPIGHAIEARIYAEKYTINPLTGENTFIPTTGTLWYHNYNLQSNTPSKVNTTTKQTQEDIVPSVRVDTGLLRTTNNNNNQVQQQQQISVYYDPMISKLIVHGPNREAAVKQLIYSLQHYHIAGVSTNIPFLLKCANHPIFQKGGRYVTTGFLQQYSNDVQIINNNTSKMDDNLNMTSSQTLKQLAGTLAIMLQLEGRTVSGTSSSNDSRRPWSSQWGSWRMGDNDHSRPKQILFISSDNDTDNKKHSISIWKNRDGSYDIQPSSFNNIEHDDNHIGNDSNGNTYHVNGSYNIETKMMEMIINGTHRMKLTTVMNHIMDTSSSSSKLIQIRTWPDIPIDDSYCWEIDVIDPRFISSSSSESSSSGMIHGSNSNSSDSGNKKNSGVIMSPMPGKVTKINYKVGDHIKIGDIVLVMEAMKMEHPLVSNCNGILMELNYQLNDMIKKDGAIVFIVSPTAEDTSSLSSSK